MVPSSSSSVVIFHEIGFCWSDGLARTTSSFDVLEQSLCCAETAIASDRAIRKTMLEDTKRFIIASVVIKPTLYGFRRLQYYCQNEFKMKQKGFRISAFYDFTY